MPRGSSSEPTSTETTAPKDPTVTSAMTGDAYPEGTHPLRPVSETSFSADKLSYEENPDKPDESSIAQIVNIPDDWPGRQR